MKTANPIVETVNTVVRGSAVGIPSPMTFTGLPVDVAIMRHLCGICKISRTAPPQSWFVDHIADCTYLLLEQGTGEHLIMFIARLVVCRVRLEKQSPTISFYAALGKKSASY